MAEENPYGDAGGTRVGSPDTPHRANESHHASKQGDGDEGGTDSGNEAARGIKEGGSGDNKNRAGSEPLKDRGTEHESGYGGKGGAPKTSSDKR